MVARPPRAFGSSVKVCHPVRQKVSRLFVNIVRRLGGFSRGKGKAFLNIESLNDIRLIGRAIKEDWPVTPEIKSQVVEALRDIVSSGIPDLVIPASRVLMAGDMLNQRRRAAEEKKLQQEQQRKLELIELAIKLGLVRDDGLAIGGLVTDSTGVQAK